MKNKRLKNILLTGLVSLIGGCSFGDLKPSSIDTGMEFRHVEGKYSVFKDKKIFYLGNVQVNYPLNEKNDFYLKVKGGSGTLDLSPNVIDGEVSGNALGGECGISYHLNESTTLDIGLELLKAEIELEGRMNKTRVKLNDEIVEWGMNLGVGKVIPLSKHVKLKVSGGYNFTDNESKRGNYDFDGSFFGIQVRGEIPK